MTPAGLTLALCGDVMLGRGVDQVLPAPGDPALREELVRDAREYVSLAEAAHGAVPRPVEAAYPWGDLLEVLDAAGETVRVVNLETSITRSDDFVPGKAVHYRMSPDNVAAVLAVRPDVVVLANNHVLDLGRRGLAETLDVLERSGVVVAGAGRDAVQASRPAVVTLPGSPAGTASSSPAAGRVLVFAVGTASAGVPESWAATDERAGEHVLPLSAAGARALLDEVAAVRRPGDVVVVSVHWGSNWGYEIPRDQVRVAHALIDGGVDVVHGHSSHHPRPVEVYRDRLVLYGCGDLINDYEGIPGYEAYRDDLRLLYLASLDPGSGALQALEAVPFRARRLRLERASPADAQWLAGALTRAGRRFGSRLVVGDSGRLELVAG